MEFVFFFVKKIKVQIWMNKIRKISNFYKIFPIFFFNEIWSDGLELRGFFLFDRYKIVLNIRRVHQRLFVNLFKI